MRGGIGTEAGKAVEQRKEGRKEGLYTRTSSFLWNEPRAKRSIFVNSALITTTTTTPARRLTAQPPVAFLYIKNIDGRKNLRGGICSIYIVGSQYGTSFFLSSLLLCRHQLCGSAKIKKEIRAIFTKSTCQSSISHRYDRTQSTGFN